MMDLHEVARHEERRCAQGMATISPESRPFAGGFACRDAPGNWSNTILGAGFDEPVDPAALDEVIAWYEAAGIEPRAEVAPFVDRSFIELLAERRFVVRVFENVFFRELSPAEKVRPPTPLDVGIHVVTVDRDDAAAVRDCGLAVAKGFALDPSAPDPLDVELSERVMRQAGVVTVAARCDGRYIGAGSMDVTTPAAALFGLSVLPEFRRRGVQLALIAARLNEAAKLGCRLATVGARPGVATERNARRMGFQVGYTKVAMVRPGPGLTPVR
jgi:GNAT superfamily N-acetyltransferase